MVCVAPVTCSGEGSRRLPVLRSAGVGDLARPPASRARFSREFRRTFGNRHARPARGVWSGPPRCWNTAIRSHGSASTSGSERQLVHDELHPYLRRLADGVPGRLRRRPTARSSDVHVVRLWTPTKPHVSKTRDGGIFSAGHTFHRVSSKRRTMIQIGSAQLWVHDQDEALEYYTKKVGWNPVRRDSPRAGTSAGSRSGPRGKTTSRSP